MKKQKQIINFSPDTRILLLPVLYLVILIIVLIISLRIGYTKIKSQKVSLASLKKMENVLKEKEATLREFQDMASKYVTDANVALPQKNPILFVISQMKNLSNEKLLVLENFSLGKGTSESIKVSFSIYGDLEQLVSFTRDTQNLSPVTTLNQVKIAFADEMATFDTSLNTFWAPYPEKIPSVSEPIVKLTSEENETLKSLSSLIPPAFSVTSPTGPYPRVSPF